jgi:phosphoribosylformylglycinamidine cyclo-ligase
MRLLGVAGGLEDDELRATFNGGLGMVVVVPAAAARRTVELATARGVPAWVVGQVVEAAALGGARYAEAGP